MVIDSAKKYSLSSYLGEVVLSRNTLYALVKRQLKIKYSSTLLGFAWAFLQPIILLILLFIVFVKVADLPTHTGVSQLGFVAVGLIVWNSFSIVFTNTIQASMSSQGVMSKVYFPRVYVPLSVIIESGIDFAIVVVMSVLLGGWAIGVHCLFFFPWLIFFFILLLSCGMICMIIIVRFNDLRFVLPLMLRVLLFITPIAYNAEIFRENFTILLLVNPLAGFVEALRYITVGAMPDMDLIAVSLGITIVLCVVAVYSFLRFDRTVGDVL